MPTVQTPASIPRGLPSRSVDPPVDDDRLDPVAPRLADARPRLIDPCPYCQRRFESKDAKAHHIKTLHPFEQVCLPDPELRGVAWCAVVLNGGGLCGRPIRLIEGLNITVCPSHGLGFELPRHLLATSTYYM